MMFADNKHVIAITNCFAGQISKYICSCSYDGYEVYTNAWSHVHGNHTVPIGENTPKRRQSHSYVLNGAYDKLLVEDEALKAHKCGDFPSDGPVVSCTLWPSRHNAPRVVLRETSSAKMQLNCCGKWMRSGVVAGVHQEHGSRGGSGNGEPSLFCQSMQNVAASRALMVKQIALEVGEAMNQDWEVVSVPKESMAHTKLSQDRSLLLERYGIKPHAIRDKKNVRTPLNYKCIVRRKMPLHRTAKWLCEHHSDNDLSFIDSDPIDEVIQLVGMYRVFRVKLIVRQTLHPES